MKKYFKLFILSFIIFNTKVLAQSIYLGTYNVKSIKSRILPPMASLKLEDNNIIFIKTFFHQDGWKVYKGIWKLKNGEIRICNLQDTAGTRPPKNRLEVSMGSYIPGKDSIRLEVFDFANFSEVEPVIIIINNKIKIKGKNSDSIRIKNVPIGKIRVDLWGFSDSIIFKKAIETSSIKLILRNDKFGTSNYYFKDIKLKINTKKLYLSDGSKLEKIKN